MDYDCKIRLKKKYLSKYKKIYEGLPESKKDKAEELIDKLATTLVYIEECNEHLLEEGVVVPMQQGNYSIDRENPYSKQHSDKTKIMIAILKELDGMTPDLKTEAQLKAGESLKAFVNKGKGSDSK